MFATDPVASRRKAWIPRPDKKVKLVAQWQQPELGAGAGELESGGGAGGFSLDVSSPTSYDPGAAQSMPPPVPPQPAGPLSAADVPDSGSGAPAIRIPARQPAGGTGSPLPARPNEWQTVSPTSPNARPNEWQSATSSPMAQSPDRGENIQPGQQSFPTSDDILRVAKSAIGSKYAWGGRGGRTDFNPDFAESDCSGYVAWAYYNATGIKLPAFTGSIYSATKSISRADAKPGDIVMWGMNNKDPHEQHVGIYLGGGSWIHDSSVNPNGGVQITPLWSGTEFRRVPGVDTSNVSAASFGQPQPQAQPQAQPQQRADTRYPTPLRPKEWFTYVDKGRKILKMIWDNGEVSFHDQGEGQGAQGTVLEPGTLSMGTGADVIEGDADPTDPTQLEVPPPNHGNPGYSMDADPSHMPAVQLQTPGFGYDPSQMHPSAAPGPDIPLKRDVRDLNQPPQPTIFDVPIAKDPAGAVPPIQMQQPYVPPRKRIDPVEGPMSYGPSAAEQPDPNANLSPIARSTAGLPTNPFEMHQQLQDVATQAVVPKQIQDAPVLGGLVEQALDPAWATGGIGAAGSHVALAGAGKLAAAGIKPVVTAAENVTRALADHALSPIAKTGIEAIIKGMDAISPGAGELARSSLPAYIASQHAVALGTGVGSAEMMNLMTDPDDPNRVPKVLAAAGMGAVAPYLIIEAHPGTVHAINQLFAPTKNLPPHVQAMVAKLAYGEEGARVAAQLLRERIKDVLADRRLGMPRVGTGLDVADAHMLFEETKGFGPNMTPAQKQLADDLFKFGEDTRKEGTRLGIISGDVTSRHPTVKAYAPHMWDEHWSGPTGHRKGATRKGLNPHDFYSHERDPNEPLMRQKAAGGLLTPVNSVSEPWAMYTGRYYSSKAKREFVRSLEKFGGPDVIARGKPGKLQVAADWVHGGKWNVPGLDQFSVSPDMAQVLDNLYGESAFRKNDIARGIMNGFAEIKKAVFAPSGFHLANELRQVINANGKEGVPIFGKALWHTVNPWAHRDFMLTNAKGIQRAADAGVTMLRGHNDAPDVGGWGMGKLGGTALRGAWSGGTTGAAAFAQSKRNLDPDQVALDNALHAGIAGAALGMAGGPISDGLWNRAVPTMKYMSWEVLAPRYGEKPAAEFVNEVFGGQNLAAIARGKTFQDALRLIAIAPDWQEGWARQIGNTLRPSFSDPLAQANRWYMINAAATSMFMLEGLNLALNGHDTRDNGPNNSLKLELTGLYDKYGWDHRDDRGRPYRVYTDILGPYRGLVEAPLDPLKFLTAREGFGPSALGEAVSGKDFTGKDIVPPGEDPLKNLGLRIGHLISRLAPASGAQMVQQKGDPIGFQAASVATGSRISHQSPIAEQLQLRDKALKDLGLTPERQQQALETYTNLLTIADRKFQDTLNKKDLTHAQIDAELMKIPHPDRPTIEAASLPPSLMADPARTKEVRDVLTKYASFGTASSEDFADLAPEDNVDINTAHDRYWLPRPGMETLPKASQDSIRQKELAAMAREYSVDVSTLLDAIKAKDRGMDTPPPVPGVTSAAIDGWVDQWVQAGASTEDPFDASAAKRTAIDTIAQQYHLSPDAVWGRIKLRRLPAQKSTDLENSRNKALDVLFAAHDPNRFPKYRDEQGQAIGTADQWQSFDAQLASLSAHDRLKPENKKLIEARQRAQAYQRKYVFDSPDTQEYERWFGVGRAMNEAQWDKYVKGGFPHYKDTRDPAENANRDKIAQQYTASTPPERRTTLVQIQVQGKPETMSLEAAHRHIAFEVQKGWTKALGLDTTGPTGVSSGG